MTAEPYDDSDLGDEDEEVTEKALSHQIDIWLDEARPERYSADEKDWIDPVIERAAEDIRQYRTVDDAVRELARRRVHIREAQATKRANRILRDIGKTGQLPLGWGEDPEWKTFLFEILRAPISIDRQRVRLGATTGEDWKEWELESARQSDKRAAAEAASREGARLLQDLMRAQGARTTEDLQPGTPGSEAA